MMTVLCMRQPSRRWIVRLACWRHTPRRVQDWLTDCLFPDAWFLDPDSAPVITFRAPDTRADGEEAQ